MTDRINEAYGATVAKRRLSRRLAAMREEARLKPNEVDDQLGWKRGKLARIERNDWIIPNASYIRDLLRVYGAPGDARAEVMDLVERASVRAWWRKYAQPGDANRVFDSEFPGFEHDAARISVYMPLVIPGLLQAPSYVDALVGSGSKPPAWRERARETRLRRQQVLDRADVTAPRLVAVVTEASLLYRWGTRTERRDQVAHLVAMSRRPNVELRLLRFEDGPHPGMSSLINIFEFPDDQDPAIVYLETDSAIQEVAKPEDVQAYTVTFGRIRQAALAPAAATAYLEKLAETLE
ncbi:MAG: helix-turn-helix domain-containing protein [Trebonia sp.]